ncbi:MAG: hypothetical protein MR902_07630 [Campylobacter sp.]|nr:hypothetical protein [Campylobacter sp.]
MRILKSNSGILKSLIKQKKAKMSLDEFIDEIVAKFAISCIKDIKESFNELIVFAYENFGLDEKSFLALLNSKIATLGIKEHKIDKESLAVSFKLNRKKLDSRVKVGFDNLDEEAIKLIDDSFYWLRNEYNSNLQDRVKNAVKDVMSGKLARKDLADRLKSELNSTLKGSESYFEGVADNIINQNRNLTAILDRSQTVKYFKVVARMDSRTSEICRSMHGRLIPVEHLDAQAKKLLNAKNMSEKKNAAIWASKAYNGRSDKLPKNFGLPPYHFHCRTMIVPVYAKEYEYDGVKMNMTSELGSKEVIKHIDKMGVERVLDLKAVDGEHNLKQRLKSGEITKQGIIKGLNSIVKTAPKKGEKNRSVAISQNGYFFVFDGNRIITVFKPKRKDYFSDNAFVLEQEIIKAWWEI